MKFFLRKKISLISHYKRKVIYLTLLTFMSGCIQTIQSSLPTAVSLVSGSTNIIISSPLGFCVDQKLANKSSGSMTLFIIDCVKVKTSNGETVRRRPLSAILTATVVDYNSSVVNSIIELKVILTKKPGINYLSKSNSTSMIKVHQVESNENLLLFLIEQRAPNIGVKQSNYFWRGFFFAKEKLVIMTASNFSDDDKSQLKLKKILLDFAKRTMVANAN
jgi:hypothetical protein